MSAMTLKRELRAANEGVGSDGQGDERGRLYL